MSIRANKRRAQIFLVLIKLLFYFLLGFIIQYNLVYVHFAEPEYTLTMLLIPVAFIIMLLGIWVVQHERTIGVVGIIVSFLASSLPVRPPRRTTTDTLQDMLPRSTRISHQPHRFPRWGSHLWEGHDVVLCLGICGADFYNDFLRHYLRQKLRPRL